MLGIYTPAKAKRNLLTFVFITWLAILSSCQDSGADPSEATLIKGTPVSDRYQNLDKSFQDYDLIKLDAETIYKSFNQKEQQQLQLDLGRFGQFNITIENNEMFAPNAVFKTDANQEVFEMKSYTYKSVSGAKNTSRFSIAPKAIVGKIKSEGQEIIIQPLGFYIKEAPGDLYLVTDNHQIQPLENNDFCISDAVRPQNSGDTPMATDTLRLESELLDQTNKRTPHSGPRNGADCGLRLRVGIDAEYFNRFTEPSLGVIAYFSYLNEYESLMEEVGIGDITVVSGFAAWHGATPWGVSNQYVSISNSFTNWADQNIPDNGHELTMIIAGTDVQVGNTNVLGATSGNSLCQPSGTMVVESAAYPQFTGFTMAHETAHTMGVISHINNSFIVTNCPTLGIPSQNVSFVMSGTPNLASTSTFSIHSRFRVQNFLNTDAACPKEGCSDILEITAVKPACYHPFFSPTWQLAGLGLFKINTPDYVSNPLQLPQYTWTATGGNIVSNNEYAYFSPSSPGNASITVSVTDGCPGLYAPAVITKTFNIVVDNCNFN